MLITECAIDFTENVLDYQLMDELSLELNSELNRRGMSMRALARASNVSVTTISGIISQQVEASADVCVKLARGLDVDPSRFLRLAGHLPPQPAPVAEEQEIVNTIRELPPGDRGVILRILKGLATEAPPPQLSPELARSKPPPVEEERRHLNVLGDAVLDLDHPIRMLYETLFEVLSPEQFACLVARLAEKATQNQARETDFPIEQECDGGINLPRGDRIPATARNRSGT